MVAILLLGGFGKRLSIISDGRPKALMPIGDMLYLDLLLERLFNYNISAIYLSLHYKAECFREHINKSYYKNKLNCIIEPKPLGTGGAINYVLNNSKILSPFFVINGDSFSNINLDKMKMKFDSLNFPAMIGISQVHNTSRYGKVLVKNNIIDLFDEKNSDGKGWINNGHYIFKKEIFSKYEGSFSLEKDLFPSLVNNNELGAYKVRNDNFIDMGVPRDYDKLCNLFSSTA